MKDTTDQNYADLLARLAAIPAQALGVAPSTVSTWLARGLPQRVAYKLVRLYGRRRIPKDPRKWAPPKEKTE